MQAKIFQQDGTENGSIKLPAEIFAVKIKTELIQRLLLLQHANKRVPAAHTLRRCEVRGTTKKYIRQKGTGNARKGARTTPLDRGGGVAWGPRNDRSFQQKMPKKMRRAALLSALSSKAQEGKINILESFSLEQARTKEFLKLKKALPQSRSLLVIHDRNEMLFRSARNLANVKPLFVGLLNIHDLTKFDQILFEKLALEKIKEIFQKSAAATKTQKINK